MKQGKKLTMQMKKLLKKNNIDPKKYLYTKNELNKLEVVNIETGNIILIKN